MKPLWLQRCPNRGRALPILGVFLLGSIAVAARADLLYFQKGGEVQAPASIDGDRVVIELAEGKYEFLREDFRKLVPGFTPRREWDARRQEARSAGFAARYEAVWWAITNGLCSEAASELRDLHGVEPKHAPTARMVATLEKLERPGSDPELADFRKVLGISTSIARGPHVVLLHQLTEAEADERIALLERVISGYYLFFAAQGIELRVPDHRLICAWFADRKDYLAFLRAQNADAFATTKGYYHPTWNAVVAYDALSSDQQQSGRETARARREELRNFQATVDRLPARARLRVTLTGESARTVGRAAALALIDRLEREVLREELLLDLERRAINEGTAAHEIIHLLAANSGLLPRHDAFPVWLQEGLAMQFEVIRGGRWAGISRANDPRLPDWRRIQPPPRLEPLIRDAGYGRGYRRDLYAQAWSLVYYLRTQHPAQFLTFLDLLRSPDASLADLTPSERSLAAFRRAFGSELETLERNWHQTMATVQTPLERHAPDPQLSSDSIPGPNPNRGRARDRTKN
jgi:Protein of unknown function (DUF1570)